MENVKINDEKKQQTDRDRKISVAIAAAIEADKAFKLYSYRILNPDDFVDLIVQSSQFVIRELANLEKDESSDTSNPE